MKFTKLFAGFVVGVTLALTAVRAEALPEFDAATITGDELVGLLTNREVQLTSEDYAALNAALKGRELTFHDFCVYGCCREQAQNGADRWFGLQLSTFCEHPGGWVERDNRFGLSLGFSDADDIRFARRIWGANHRCGDGVIKTLSGVVGTDFHFGPGGLQLKATDLEPREPIEELPGFDEKTITGDELVKLVLGLRQKELSIAQRIELRTRLAGRRLTFHKAWQGGASGDMNGWSEVTFKFCLYDDVRDGKACEFNVHATLRTPEPREQDESRYGNNWTVEGTVEPPKKDDLCNDENVLTLTDAVIKWEPTDERQVFRGCSCQ